MNEIILKDRTTLLNVALTIGDGVFTMTATIAPSTDEPIIADARAEKNWKLFVDDGMLSWEETESIALKYNELVDTDTGVNWRLYILDGQFAYSHIISVSRARESRITFDEDRNSVIFSYERLDSEISDGETRISNVVKRENRESVWSGGSQGDSIADKEIARLSVACEQLDAKSDVSDSANLEGRVSDQEIKSSRIANEEGSAKITTSVEMESRLS